MYVFFRMSDATDSTLLARQLVEQTGLGLAPARPLVRKRRHGCAGAMPPALNAWKKD